MDKISAKAQSIVRAPPNAVFDAFVDGKKMSLFWFTRKDEGLQEGKNVTWFVGKSADAYPIAVHVVELRDSELISIDWGFGENVTRVRWQMEKTNNEHTILTIEESGYKGTTDQILAKALDSTGGFNQVIIALKALLEHGAIINVVEDHT